LITSLSVYSVEAASSVEIVTQRVVVDMVRAMAVIAREQVGAVIETARRTAR
jgi:hypothetical protein